MIQSAEDDRKITSKKYEFIIILTNERAGLMTAEVFIQSEKKAFDHTMVQQNKLSTILGQELMWIKV